MVGQLVVLCLLVATTFGRVPPRNAEVDARMQANKLLRCWVPNNLQKPTAGYHLSEAKYDFCSYMPSLTDVDSYYVNGVDNNSDDYSAILKLFAEKPTVSMLNVCLQEGFSLMGPDAPGQVSLRCLCKRDACNIPSPLTTYIDFNKDVINAPTL
uniref:ZP domain-containing protein n=1 Tax=Caenorhabditis tropicalis TaxID=1561998 RepID=A0A1I7TN36_9PELO